MRLTLRTKFMGTTLLVALAGMGLGALLLPGYFRRPLYEEMESGLAAQAYLLRQYYAPVFQRGGERLDLQQQTHALSYRLPMHVTLLDAEGHVYADSLGKTALVTDDDALYHVREAFHLGEKDHPDYIRSLEGNRMALTMPLVRRDANSLAMRVSLPLNEIEAEVGQHTRQSLILLSLVTLVILALQHMALTSATGPLRLMARTARRISEGSPHERVRVRLADEVGDLARAFNLMTHSMDARIGHLREAEATMRTAFAHMADGVVVLDTTGRVLLFNSVAEEAFGMPATKAQGRTLLDIALHPELDALVSQALRTGEMASGEIQLRRPALRILRAYITPIPGKEDSLLGVVLVFHDLTEVRRLENIRRDFVTNASHELKTPLATINVMVDSLKTGMEADPETAQRFLTTIGSEVQRLGALVDDLLDLSKIESGNLRIEPEVISLKPVLRSLVETYLPAAEDRSQTLAASQVEDALIWADPNTVIRIGSNLIENALKYTPDRGIIEVSCGVVEGNAFLRVADTGVGIPEADLGRIFERFYRVDKARSRATGGTGLGLSIVKHLVEAQGGRIEVESALGRGSRFTVWLPAIAEEEWMEEESQSLATER